MVQHAGSLAFLLSSLINEAFQPSALSRDSVECVSTGQPFVDTAWCS